VSGDDLTFPATTTIFVACPSLFADWIEDLYNEQITGGCGDDALLSGQRHDARTDGRLSHEDVRPALETSRKSSRR
jgi:hypothetical protein